MRKIYCLRNNTITINYFWLRWFCKNFRDECCRVYQYTSFSGGNEIHWQMWDISWIWASSSTWRPLPFGTSRKQKKHCNTMYFCLYTGHWFSSVTVLESTARVMKDWEKLWQSEAMWLSLTIMVRNIYFLLGWNYMQDNYLSFSCCTYHKIYSTRHDRAKMARYH